jgi:hypothetical protein
MRYEVELRQEGLTVAAWRPVSLMRTRTFATLAAAKAPAACLNRRETRIVAVGRDGQRRTVDAAGT